MARKTNNKLRCLSSAAFTAAVLLTMAPMADTPVRAQDNAAAQTLRPIPDPSDAEVAALIKEAGITESAKTASELVPGWTRPKMMLVHIDRPDRLAWLQKAAPGVKLVGVYQKGTLAQKEAEALPYAAEADAFIYVLPYVLCDEKVIKAAKKLEWMHSYGAGIDDCIAVSPEVAAGKFLLTNSQKIRSRWLAENVFAAMVTLMRGMDVMTRMDMGEKLIQPHWGNRGMQMEGRTLLVVGLGGIGGEVAKMAHGIGMKVIATRETSHQGPDYVDYVGLASELPDLIGKADVVAMTAPLTKETKGMFNAEMFGRMKNGAIFVNTSREDVFVKEDLIAALKSGQLGAAAMNANTGAPGERPPLAPHDPMWRTPNLLYTTHGAAPSPAVDGSDSSTDRSWILTREEMRRYVNNEKMLSVVDVQRGY